MTGLLWFAAGAVTAGPFLGLILHMILAGRVRSRAYAVCQSQALSTFGTRRAVFGDVNPAVVPRLKRRSPDEQFIAREFSDVRSVLGDQAR